MAAGRKTGVLNGVEVVFTNASVGLQLPRIPFKIDNPLSFHFNGSLILCGGRTRTSLVLSICITLNYKKGVAFTLLRNNLS